MTKIFLGPGIYTRVNSASSGSNLGGVAINSGGTAAYGSPHERYIDTASTNTTTLLRTNWATAAATYYYPFYYGTTSTYNKYLAGGATGATRLNIYSGGRPSISNITNLNDYASNLLVSFSIPAYSTTRALTGYYIDQGTAWPAANGSGVNTSTTVNFTGSTIYLGICPSFTAASGSGVASWFWFGNYSSPSNLSGLSFVTGSVGLIGSNSDLEMADASIVSGSLYKSFGFKLYIPVLHQDN